MADEKPVIIVKKKGGHGGHHGGAWKVAYADFVTAMMAFFLVMWLVNSAEVTTRQSIASYFRRPGLFSHGSGTPLMMGESGILNDAYAPSKSAPPRNAKRKYKDKPTISPPDAVDRKPYEPGEGSPAGSAAPNGEKTDSILAATPPPSAAGEQNNELLARGSGGYGKGSGKGKSAAELEKEAIQALAQEIKAHVESSPELRELLGIVDVKVDSDGLNIEIMDTDKASMFGNGSATILPDAQIAFEKLSTLLSKMPNKVEIVGHTDGHPYSSDSGYSNWELSADRANAARKLLIEGGIPADRITGVVGRADTDLKKPEDPFAAANRRITLKMKFSANKKIDISEDPEAIEKINKEAPVEPQPVQKEEVHSIPATSEALTKEEVTTTETPAVPTPTPVVERRDTGTYTPRKLREGKNKKITVAIPEEKPPAEETPTESTKTAPTDTILGEHPVLNPGDPFSGL